MRLRSLSLAAAVLVAAVAYSQDFVQAGKPTSIKPRAMASFKMDAQGRVHFTSPWIPYLGSNITRVGNLLFDNFEGDSTDGANPDAPTDGLYGEQYFFGTANGDTNEPGTRWIRRAATYNNTLFARQLAQLFPGGANQEAIGVDMLMNQNTDEPFIYLIATSDTWSDSTPPTLSDYTGIAFDFGQLAPGFYYSNADLTGTGLSIRMPVSGSGGMLGILGQSIDDQGNVTLSTQAQPGLWGTKPLNPSQIGRTQWQDGKDDNAAHNGAFEVGENIDMLFLSATTKQIFPVSYTVTRGVEQGSNDVNKIKSNDGNLVVVQQRAQVSPILPNAEIVAVLTVGPEDQTLLRTFRVKVREKSNMVPLSDVSAKIEIGLKNWVTNKVDIIDVRKPSGSLVDVQALNINKVSIDGKPKIMDYIRTGDRRVEVSVRAFHARPLSPAWTLSVDSVDVIYANSGPLPLGPAVAFSMP